MSTEQNLTESDNFSIGAMDAKLALLLIEKPSSTDQELAMKLGISRQTVNRRKRSQTVQKIVRDTLAIPEREVRRLAAKALTRLETLLDHEDPRVKLAATLALVKLSERFMGDNLDSGLW
jgi:transcriptional regulator with XRE-family HTH domain